jgi:hypothetical protein
MRVAVPWSLSRYIPLNGFHPLYQPLFEGDARLEFAGVDIPALARAVQHSGYFAGEGERRATALGRAFIEAAPDADLAPSFVNHVTPEELWMAADLPGDLEFHHTSPCSAGSRPFVVHCESFLPFFFPFFRHGDTSGFTEHTAVRSLYRSILGAPACIGILSHIPETLAELSRFLADPAIDRKLGATRIGLGERNLRTLLDAPCPRPAPGPVFLFTNSAHQNLGSVPLRGGIAVLRFAEQYLRAGHPGRFVFRTMRPPEESFAEWGVDTAYLRSQEPGRVEWIERFVDEAEQMRLFAQADVMLLPSANLHSVTLMQALAAGAVPVVTDTFGTQHYVTDGETGVVLGGVRERIWSTHAASGIRYDRHEAFPALADSLVAQMFAKLLPLLQDPAALAAMRERMRREVRQRFSGAAYRDALCEDLERRMHGRREAPARPSLLARFGAVRTGGWEALFGASPVPRRQAGEAPGGGLHYIGGGLHYRVRGALLPQLDRWSPFVLRRNGLLGERGTQVFDTLQELQDEAAASPAARMLRDARLKAGFALRRWQA